MIDQELASVMHFFLEAAPGISPLYHAVPEHFIVPAIYFPPPELTMEGDTFATYNTRASWYIQIFHSRDDLAYAMARDMADAIMRARRLVPLRDTRGVVLAGEWLRLDDPQVKSLDLSGVGGGAQISIAWDSRRPYNAEDAQKMMEFYLSFNDKPAASGREMAVGGHNNV